MYHSTFDFLLSSLTVSVKSGTKCPVESDSAVVLAILLTAPPLKCYKVLEPDPPDKKSYIVPLHLFSLTALGLCHFIHENRLLESSESVLSLTKVAMFMGYFGDVNHCMSFISLTSTQL